MDTQNHRPGAPRGSSTFPKTDLMPICLASPYAGDRSLAPIAARPEPPYPGGVTTPTDLCPLPAQPPHTPWPTQTWPVFEDAARCQQVGEQLETWFSDEAREQIGQTFALLVVQGGRLVAERYDDEHDASSTLPSWSMAKSFLHALVGTLVRDGLLDIHAPAAVPRWQGDDDPRRAITLENLLRMSSGLEFNEAYELGKPSDAIGMLFGKGQDDVARYAEEKPLQAPPGTWWNYSSGTSNIVSAIVHRTLGVWGDDHRAQLFERLFDPIGMRSCEPKYDAAGTWIGSSFNFATARDFARFGLLYLRDGVWDGKRILPEGWADHARSITPNSDGWYGGHFWHSKDGSHRFTCNGFRSQYIIMDPERDLVVVRSGDTDDPQKPALLRSLAEIVEAWPALA